VAATPRSCSPCVGAEINFDLLGKLSANEQTILSGFITRPLIASQPQPYLKYDRAFLNNSDNRTFTSLFTHSTSATNAVPPRKPSHLFAEHP